MCRFFHSVCWRAVGLVLTYQNALLHQKLNDSLQTWRYVVELSEVVVADEDARVILTKCHSLTRLSIGHPDERLSCAAWMPPPESFARLRDLSLEIDECCSGELGAWACKLPALKMLQLRADDEASCATWRALGGIIDHRNGDDNSDGDDDNNEESSCSDEECAVSACSMDLSRLPIAAMQLIAEQAIPSHKLRAIALALNSRLHSLYLKIGDAESPVPAPDLSPLTLLSCLRVLVMPDVEAAGRLRLPLLPALESLTLNLHDTSFSLRSISAMYSLCSISIRSTFSFTRTSPDHLSSLRALTNLTCLNVSHSPEEIDTQRVCAAELSLLSRLTSLTCIKLNANFEPSHTHQLQALSFFSRLTFLSLSYSDLSLLQGNAAWLPLQDLKALAILKLKAVVFPVDAEPHLAHALASLHSLQTLHLDPHTEWNCTSLARVLPTLATMHTLCLGRCRIDQFTRVVSLCTQLSSLSFWKDENNTPFDLCRALPSLRRLRIILTNMPWVELSPHPLLLLRRIPDTCVNVFYQYGYLHNMNAHMEM